MSDAAWEMFKAMPEARQRNALQRFERSHDRETMRVLAGGLVLGALLMRLAIWSGLL